MVWPNNWSRFWQLNLIGYSLRAACDYPYASERAGLDPIGLGPGLGYTSHSIWSPNLPRFINNRLLSLIRLNTNLFNLIKLNKTLNLKIY